MKLSAYYMSASAGVSSVNLGTADFQKTVGGMGECNKSMDLRRPVSGWGNVRRAFFFETKFDNGWNVC